MKVTFEDTSHALPSRSAERTGADVLERLIREAVDGEHKQEQRDREAKEKRESEERARERKNAEGALGEFLGLEMWPTRRAEFHGASRHGLDYWEFRVGGLVFKLTRCSANSVANNHGTWLKRPDYVFAVTTEFERIYGSRKLRDAALEAGEEKYQKWEWHEIDSLAQVAELRRAGRLEQH